MAAKSRMDSTEQGTDELLQLAERSGLIEMRLNWKVRVRDRPKGGKDIGPMIWRALPKTRATMAVKTVEQAYVLMEHLDRELARLTKGDTTSGKPNHTRPG